MAPPRSGYVEPFKRADGKTYYRARVRLADDSRARVDVPERYANPAGGKSARERAELYAAALQEREDETGDLLAAKRTREAADAKKRDPLNGETWDAWFKRYLPARECGENHRAKCAAVASKWISPVIGTKPVVSLTRDDVEDVRDKLDRALDAKLIRHGTARNAWGVLTGALKAAYAARDRTLRVLSGTPIHYGVLPPKRGETRQRPWLYPVEWSLFATSSKVSPHFQIACALALYTGLRPGELRALLWRDVDLKARTISISKAFDAHTKSVKAPKTLRAQRIVPIHESLLPLLIALEGDDEDRVLGSFNLSEDHMAPAFRAYLVAAGIDRPRLTANNAAEEPIDFRSLRDSHATWLALDGVPSAVIQRRMGHTSPVTTDRYVKAAESFSAQHIGAPFPALPLDHWPKDWPKQPSNPRHFPGKLVARG
jgi:integrase